MQFKLNTYNYNLAVSVQKYYRRPIASQFTYLHQLRVDGVAIIQSGRLSSFPELPRANTLLHCNCQMCLRTELLEERKICSRVLHLSMTDNVAIIPVKNVYK